MIFLPALNFGSDWFVINKVIKKLIVSLFRNDGILFFDEDSGNVTLSSDQMGILSVAFNNINLDDVAFDENDSETIIHVRLGLA